MFTQITKGLEARSTALSAHVVALVWEQVSGYDRHYLEAGELTERVKQTVDAVISGIVDDQVSLEALRHAYELGTRRARQGLALESIIFSYRNAERVLTRAFHAEAQDVPARDAQEGMRRMLRALDELAAAAIDGYHATERELSAHRDSLSTQLISGLAFGELSSRQILTLAESLGCEPASPYTAIAVVLGATRGVGATSSIQRDLIGALGSSATGRIVIGAARDAKVVLVPAALDEADMDRLRTVVHGHAEIQPRMAVGEPSSEITTSGVSCRQALRALAVTKTSTRPLVRYRDLVADMVASTIDDDLHAWLAERCQQPLAGHDALRETIIAYVANDMSAGQTARALSIHANTVHYRLKRILELTGMDPRSTPDLFALLLACRLEATGAPRP
ncbi:PucR family transcriptional regulator [Euzebya tangerina]|uniref:PucR family transcriptional regulator n=1 Tax=Euzebya tangerina TaxID=591198 RepID=UPI000E31DDA7|nr:helix-turn-helix domain-containing protein [Euzebya tangerina]